MAVLDLRVDYKDDILDSSVNTKRKYNIIENEDGTKSLEDVSVYTQNGDSFGGADINKTNQAVLDLNSSLNNLSDSVLLGQYALNDIWEIKNISGHNISDFREIMISLCTTDFNFIFNPVRIPTDIFKTLTSTTNQLSDFAYFSGKQNQASIYYVNETQIGVYTDSTCGIKIYGIK